MFRRIAVVVLAVAMIAGGIAIRNSRGGEAPRRGLADDANLYSVFDGDEGSIVCAPELAALCEGLTGLVGPVRIEPTWITADRLAGGGVLGADAWLAFRPLDEMVAPPASPSTLAPASPVGRSPIVLAASPAVIGGVEAACRDPRVLLSCAGSVAGVQLMLRDPATSVVGAVALDVLAGELGVAAPGVVDEEGAASLRVLLSRSRLTPVPYEDVSRLPEGSVALTLEADVNFFLRKLPFEERRNYSGVSVLYPFEARAAEVVVMPARSFRRADDLVAVINSTKTALRPTEPASMALAAHGISGRSTCSRSGRPSALTFCHLRRPVSASSVPCHGRLLEAPRPRDAGPPAGPDLPSRRGPGPHQPGRPAGGGRRNLGSAGHGSTGAGGDRGWSVGVGGARDQGCLPQPVSVPAAGARR